MDGYVIAAVIVVFTFIAVVFMIRSARSAQKKLQEAIADQFGQVPDHEDLELDSICKPWKYCTEKDPLQTVDDITWNDLDMNQIFSRLDTCQTSLGEEQLYILLHKFIDENETNQREGLMEYLDSEPELRLQLQLCLDKVGKSNYNGLIEFIKSSEVHGLNHAWIYNVFALLPIVSILFFLVNSGLGTACILGSICLNIIASVLAKRKIEQELASIRYFSAVLWGCKKICKLQGEGLLDVQQNISKKLKLLHGLGGKISSSMRNPLVMGDMDAIQEYARMISLHDIRSYNKLIHLVCANKEACLGICEDIADLDVAIAILSYRKSLPIYSKPHFIQHMQLNLQELYHPLLQSAVPNSVLFTRDSIITGSNASGKSTFIKAVAVNGILAMALNTCSARVFQAPRALVISSMATRDNLLIGDSYFVAEIKSLKRVLDHAQSTSCLCFIDEILKGTNTVERIAASTAVLRYLHQKNSLCLVASHDIELTQILENEFENYHFSEQITNHEIVFDYQIKDGPSKTTNAVKLLAYTGYDEEIIRNAEEMVSSFQKAGSWNNL